MQTPPMNLERIRYTLARKSALMLFVIIFFATIIRPIFVELPLLLTYIGVFNSVLMGGTFFLLKYTHPKQIYLYLFLLSAFISLVPLLCITGGVNSHFAVLIPIIPIVACLIANSIVGIIATVVVFLLIISLYFFAPQLQDINVLEYDNTLQIARAFWLFMGTLLGLFLSLQFNKFNNRLSENLVYQANTDVLTGILNRRCILALLNEKIHHLTPEQKYVSILLLDIDHFKKLNDEYGHLFGDECLTKVANCLQSVVRQNVDFVGRYGGEEFLLIVNNVDKERLHYIAEKVRHSISQLVCLYNDEKEIGLTVTIGYCSMLASEVDSSEQIIHLADTALYRGKNHTRNCVVSA